MIMKDGHNIATIRAEQNTITNCAKRGTSSNGCTVYVTHYLCYNCMKLIV
jgi:dCMP deaminase